MSTKYFGKKRHPRCRCGTGCYCHHHLCYGLGQLAEEQTHLMVRGKVHLIPSSAVGDQLCGGGRRVIRRGVKAT